MSFFNKYPYSDMHELNLDWLIAKMKELNIAFDEFKVINQITFSGAWDITKQYPAWTIVSDNNIGYVSIQPVPAGVLLTDGNYWREVIDYTAQIAGLQQRVVDLENSRLVKVDTVSDLIAYDAVEGDYIMTGGYNTLFDGGSALYRAVSLITIYGIALNNGLYAEFVPFTDTICPEMFGAVGDGITDDVQAFEDMFKYNLKAVLQEGKTYSVSNGFKLKPGTVIDLNNSTIYFSNLSDIYTCSFRNFDTTDTEVTGYDGVGNITIRNGILDRVNMPFIHSHDLLFENLYVKNFPGHFMQFAGCTGVKIIGCTFDTIGGPNAEEINIDQCDYGAFPFIPSGSTTFDGTICTDFEIKGCTFNDSNGLAYGIGNHAVTSPNNKHEKFIITDNMFDSLNGRAISLYSFTNTVISNNVFKMNNGNALHLADCEGVIISNNVVKNVTNNAFIKLMASRSYALSVIGNHVQNGTLIDFNSLVSSFIKLQRMTLALGINAQTYTIVGIDLPSDIAILYLTAGASGYTDESYCMIPTWGMASLSHRIWINGSYDTISISSGVVSLGNASNILRSMAIEI